MTGGGVSDDDMPIFPWSSRGGVPPVGDPAFDALLAGHLAPGDTAETLRPVAEAIAALNAAPVTSELAAETRDLAVFSAAGRSGEPGRSRRRRRPLLISLLSAKLAAAAVVALGGAAAAAYAGVMPAPAQRFAHDILGAPSAGAQHTVQPTQAPPSGPAATGHTAYGLCTAYAHLKAHGSAGQKATAFRNLAAAAGGAANVTAYCARAAHPGTTPSPAPAAHATGKPSAQAPATHPAGRPSTHPAGRPSTHPIGQPSAHATGMPSTLPAHAPATHPAGKPAAAR